MARDLGAAAGGGGGGSIAVGLSAVTNPFTAGLRGAETVLGSFAGRLGVAGAALGIFAGVEMFKAIGAAQRFEDNMIRLRKVAGEDFGGPIARQIRDLSTTLPIASQELFDVAESAVRLGIRGTENIRRFVSVMGQVGAVTDMNALDAAENFARLAEVMDVPIEKVENLAATANELSDTMATSFTEVVQSVGQVAPVFQQLGVLPEQQIAFAAAQNEVNISVRRGARALRSFLQQLQETNRAADISEPLGMTVEAFRDLMREDPVELIMRILTVMREGGDRAIALGEAFDSVGRIGIQSLSQNMGGLRTALGAANDEMEEAGSLQRQFSAMVDGTSSRQQILTNRIEAFRSEIGEGLLPLKSDLMLFFADTLQFINAMVRDSNRLLEVYEKLPERMADAFVETEMAREDPLEFIKDFPLRGELFNRVLEQSSERLAAMRFQASGLTEAIHGYARSLETAEGRQRLMDAAMGEVREQLESKSITYDEAIDLLKEYTVRIARWESAVGDARPEAQDWGNDLEDVEEKLKGINIQLARETLSSMYGVALKDVSEDTARFLLDLAEQEKQFLEGEEAARRFSLGLQNIPEQYIDMAIQRERFMRQDEEFSELEEEIHRRRQEIGKSQFDLLREQIEAMDGISDARKGLLIEQVDALEQDEREREVKEELKSTIRGLKDEIFELREGEDALMIAKLRRMGADEEDIRQIRELLKERKKLNEQIEAEGEQEKEAKRVERRIQRMIERVDVTSVENRFRILDQTVEGVADNIVNLFDIMADENKTFAEAMMDTIRQIGREFAKMFLRFQLMKLLEGSDLFGDFAGLDAGGGSVSGFTRGQPRFDPGSGSSGVGAFEPGGGMGGSNVNFNVNYSIQALDSKDVNRMLKEQGPIIAEETAKQFSRSRQLQRLANA